MFTWKSLQTGNQKSLEINVRCSFLRYNWVSCLLITPTQLFHPILILQSRWYHWLLQKGNSRDKPVTNRPSENPWYQVFRSWDCVRDKPTNSSYNWVLKNNLFPLNGSTQFWRFKVINIIDFFEVAISVTNPWQTEDFHSLYFSL